MFKLTGKWEEQYMVISLGRALGVMWVGPVAIIQDYLPAQTH